MSIDSSWRGLLGPMGNSWGCLVAYSKTLAQTGPPIPGQLDLQFRANGPYVFSLPTKLACRNSSRDPPGFIPEIRHGGRSATWSFPRNSPSFAPGARMTGVQDKLPQIWDEQSRKIGKFNQGLRKTLWEFHFGRSVPRADCQTGRQIQFGQAGQVLEVGQ